MATTATAIQGGIDMERLTGRIGKYADVIEMGNLMCREVCATHSCDDCSIQRVFEKLAHYEDLEEQGLLLKLPCKVGETIYSVEYNYRAEIVERTVVSFEITKKDIWVYGECDKFIGGLGKTVFGTKEEAEAKLKEMEN